MKLFNELPTILPFYTEIRNQNRFKENVREQCPVHLLSPSDAFVPFVIKLPANSTRPTVWKIMDTNNNEVADISNNIGLLKAFDFGDSVYCYYKGQQLTFKFETIEQPLNLSGHYYLKFTIDGADWFSETFKMCQEIKHDSFSNRFVKISFWDQIDIVPIKYHDGFKQSVYFDTFIHTSEPEIEEESEKDGFGNEFPVFQKLIIKQKMEVVVPDFVKIAMLTLQMHNEVEVNDQNKRSGKVDRTKVVATTEEFGSFSTLDFTFETDILIKSVCEENDGIISEVWN